MANTFPQINNWPLFCLLVNENILHFFGYDHNQGENRDLAQKMIKVSPQIMTSYDRIANGYSSDDVICGRTLIIFVAYHIELITPYFCTLIFMLCME